MGLLLPIPGVMFSALSNNFFKGILITKTVLWGLDGGFVIVGSMPEMAKSMGKQIIIQALVLKSSITSRVTCSEVEK